MSGKAKGKAKPEDKAAPSEEGAAESSAKPQKKSRFGKKKSGKKTSADLFEAIDWDNWDELLSMDDAQAKKAIEELTITGTGKTPEQVDEENTENFEKAFKSAKFAQINDKDSSLNSVLPKDKMAAANEMEEVTEDDFKTMVKHSLVFAFLHGNITAKKYWFLFKTEGEEKFYAALPELDVDTRRSTLVHVYREQIGNLLTTNNNTLLTVLARSEVTVHESKRKYCFPKGHLLVDTSEIQQVRTELGRIFEQMKKRNLAEREFDLPWFTNEGSWDSIKKKLESEKSVDKTKK